MKKLSLLLLLSAFSFGVKAQTATAVITTAPCNHDGVVTTTFTGLTPPLTVTYRSYSGGAPIVHTGVTGLSDVLLSYSGADMYVVGQDGSGAIAMAPFYAPPFSFNIKSTPALCPALGTDTVSVTGGTAPYTFQWFDMGTMTTVGTTDPINLPGNALYGVTITDAAGCVFGSLDMPDSTAYLGSLPSYSVTLTPTTASCTNGTVTSSVGSGAIPPITYSWSTGASTANIIGLVMGNYTVYTSDAIGCTASASVYVPQSITIAVPVTPTMATCVASDGSAIAFGSGGLPPYSYKWNTGATTQNITGLPSGNYNVAVTDANGCIGSGYTYVGASTPIAVTYSTTPTLCVTPTGTASLSITGGTAPYSTMWYTTPLQTGITATGLAQGDFAFRVTDAMGCVQSGRATVPPVDVIAASFFNTAPLCTLATGSIVVTPSGGVAPYSYTWSTGATGSTLSSIPWGTYHVTITDAMGCKNTLSEYLPYNSTLGVGLTGTNATCLFVSDGTLSAGAYGGTTPYHYAWTGGGTTSTIIGLPANIPYWVTVTDALGCSATIGTTLGADTLSTCYCTISGTVYNDLNGNCVQDPGEAGVNHIKIGISGRGYTFTDTLGHYSYKVPSGTYTVAENVLAYYPLSTCQTNSVTVTSVAGTGCVLPVDFANTLDTIHDMHICTWDYTMAIPGHTYTQVTILTNNGSVTEPHIYSGYQPDGQFYAPLYFSPAGTYHGSSNFYSTSGTYPLLDPGNAATYYTTYNVPTNIPLGTNVVFKDTVASDTAQNWLTDYSPWNNVHYLNTTVVASLDPNFKEVSPKGTGPTGIISLSDTVLEYMVHFQNTGTYMAENIRVVDTLDDNLDWTTLSDVYTSGQAQVTVDQSGPRRVATFMFNNINLPPVSSEPITSNGMLSYSIKLKKGLALGTQVKNSASIYFDYNTPVKTNQTLNTIGSNRPIDQVTNTAKTNGGSFTVFPNPAANTFSAVINSISAGQATISVSDISGKTLISEPITMIKGTQNVPVAINQLTPGIYLVHFTQNGTSQTQKLVVIKQ